MTMIEAETLDSAHLEQPRNEGDRKNSGLEYFDPRDAKQFEETLLNQAFEEHPKHTLTPATVPGAQGIIEHQALSEEIHVLKSQIAEIEEEQERLQQHLTKVEQNAEKSSETISLSLTHLLLQLNENNLTATRNRLENSEKALLEQPLATSHF